MSAIYSGSADFLRVHAGKASSWKQFIQSHLDVTWAADFFTEEMWTCCGLVTYYAPFFIHLRTRRVHFVGCTAQPDTGWMRHQALWG